MTQGICVTQREREREETNNDDKLKTFIAVAWRRVEPVVFP